MKKKQRKLFFDFRYFFYDFVKFTGIIPQWIYLKIKKRYLNGHKPKGLYKGRFLVVSNHISMKDAIIMQYVFFWRRLSIMSTIDMLYNPKWGKFFTRMRCIFVDKDNPSMKQFKEIAEVYRRGHVVGMFPEGTITTLDAHTEYKDGSVMVAILNDCPIIPMYIHPRENWHQKHLVIVGEKIDYHDYVTSKVPTLEEIKKVTAVINQKEMELAEYASQLMKKGKKHE